GHRLDLEPQFRGPPGTECQDASDGPGNGRRGCRHRPSRRCATAGLEGPPMEKFTQLTGIAAPMPAINIDTDKIFPAVYLKTIKRTGLSKWLFQEVRFRADGSENPDFVLNQGPYRQAKIIVAGDNFGCGSSREHAPWALTDFGIKCGIG